MTITIRKTLYDLQAQIVGIQTHSSRRAYPTEFQTFEEAWDNLGQSLLYLKDALGTQRYAQLVEMAEEAKRHFEAAYASNDKAEIILGSRLMQDMEQVVKGKPPFAYPSELYRWEL